MGTLMDVRQWIVRFAELVAADTERLTSLDSAIGDGDHGTNLNRGLRAAVEALDGDLPAGKVLMTAGRALVSKTGGASGPLYGTALRRAGKALGDDPDGTVDATRLGEALQAALDAIRELGKAEDGDKTMVDALAPAVAAYTAHIGDGLAAAARAALDAAEKGAEATIPLQARKGRASYLGPRSVGHMDPGAASTVLLFRALADTV
jgi:dihydroxyacetone kinase phosphoprotein-dependent L subunit